MMKTTKSKTFVELEGKLDQLTQKELGNLSGGEQMSSQASDINPYTPPPPPKPVH